MRYERLSLSLPKEKRGYFLIVSILSILCFSEIALAQSGRRQSKNISPSPPISVEAKAEGEAKTPTAKPAPAASLVIGGNSLSSSFDIPSGALDIAMYACIERLEKASSLTVTSGGNNMSRKEAIDKAKKLETPYVVLLELRVENYNSSSSSIILEYSVFSPQTAKVKTFGHVYLDRAQLSNGRVGVGLPPSSTRRLSLDYLLREGGRNVANRVMEAFHVTARN
jgi:hypothetical protein